MRWIFATFLAVAGAYTAAACSFCPTFKGKQNTLGEEIDQARFVVLGRLVSSKLNTAAGATPGSGVSEIEIESIVKKDPYLDGRKALTVNKYLPVLDPKQSARMLLFGGLVEGKADIFAGKNVNGPEVIAYLEKAQPIRAGKDATARLLYYFDHLDHADELIADDAFREFAKADDATVAAAAKHCSPEKLRGLIGKTLNQPDRLGLYAFLLGASGSDRDADFLKKMLDAQPEKSLDGLLCGYIALRPADGWQRLRTAITDPKSRFAERYGAICAMRFCYTWRPKEFQAEAIKTQQIIVADGELADFAVEDLRRWKLWDATDLVLSQYGKKTHNSPIVRRAIVRYALCCPLAPAKEFVARVRVMDRELVEDVADGLQYETK